MAYNTMTPITARPYVINNNVHFVKKKEDEESSNSSRTFNQEQDELQISPNPNQNQSRNKNVHEQLLEAKASHNEALASRDANLKNASVNIAQILKDFRNTAKAIGASPELTDEVNNYLALVEKEVTKENPDPKLVRSNLKNASTLLDNYITETLQRPSKVVENWIDALFLQQINYKFNEGDINPQFLVKFPNQKNEEENSKKEDAEEQEENEQDKDESQEVKAVVKVPEDEKLKSLFIQAKKQVYANNYKKAMGLFKEALDRAIEVADKETESKVLFEIGKIYDKHDYLVQALTSYNKSLEATSDMNVKTKAHYSMAQIYDDVAQFEPAINHYMSSISYAGENENFIAQSTSLTKIGNIYTDKYKKEAFDFLLEAEEIAKQSKDPKTKGFVSGHIANSYKKFREPQNALKYYSHAVKDYQEADSIVKVAINYKRAAEVMKDYKNYEKAKALFRKALTKAKQTEDANLITEIHDALNII